MDALRCAYLCLHYFNTTAQRWCRTNLTVLSFTPTTESAFWARCVAPIFAFILTLRPAASAAPFFTPWRLHSQLDSGSRAPRDDGGHHRSPADINLNVISLHHALPHPVIGRYYVSPPHATSLRLYTSGSIFLPRCLCCVCMCAYTATAV